MIRFPLLLSCLFFLPGCATSFTSRANPPSVLETQESFYIENVPPIDQKAYQCGPAALESVIRYWGGSADADSIGQAIYGPGTRGVLNFTLAQHMKAAGFWTEIHEGRDESDLKRWLRKKIPPIVMLDTGTLWVRAYHFVVVKGFDDRAGIFYANTGVPETQAITYGDFMQRWKKADRWTLIVSLPEKVDWGLDEAQSIELALIFEKMGDLGRAEQWDESAMKINPDSAAAKFNLANIYGRTGRPEQAKTMYRDLLNKNPNRAEISNNLAWIYYEEGGYEDALRVIEAAFKSGAKKNYDILDTAGLIYWKLGRIAEARQAFSDAEDAIPAENSRALAAVRSHLDSLPLRVSPIGD